MMMMMMMMIVKILFTIINPAVYPDRCWHACVARYRCDRCLQRLRRGGAELEDGPVTSFKNTSRLMILGH